MFQPFPLVRLFCPQRQRDALSHYRASLHTSADFSRNPLMQLPAFLLPQQDSVNEKLLLKVLKIQVYRIFRKVHMQSL